MPDFAVETSARQRQATPAVGVGLLVAALALSLLQVVVSGVRLGHYFSDGWAAAAILLPHGLAAGGLIAAAGNVFQSLVARRGDAAVAVTRAARFSFYAAVVFGLTAAAAAGTPGRVAMAATVAVPVAAFVYFARSAGIRKKLGREFGNRMGEAGLKMVSRDAAIAVLLMLVSLVTVLAIFSVPTLRQFGWHFVTGREWRPNALQGDVVRGPDGAPQVDDDGNQVFREIPPAFGALPVIFGTTVSSVIALVVAVPLSLGASVFLVRVAAGWMVGPVSFLIEFLAAIPSIAYGIWGLFVLCPFLQGTLAVPRVLAWIGRIPVLGSAFHRADSGVYFNGIEPWLNRLFTATPGLHWLASPDGGLTGRDMLAGGLILGIMIVPIVTAISRDVLKSVPRAQLEGTVALGATWWESSKEMLKYSRSGLFGAVMLGLARAAGETMAITMVIGNNTQIKASLFAPAQTMSSLLANEFQEAGGELQRSALTEVALILLVMSLLFNVVARYLVVGKQSRTAAAH